MSAATKNHGTTDQSTRKMLKYRNLLDPAEYSVEGYKDGNKVLDIGKYLFLLTQSSTWI